MSVLQLPTPAILGMAELPNVVANERFANTILALHFVNCSSSPALDLPA
ncbi:hypothetical protein PI125_g11910 [Phytophthora idaei]|nr:hypothetical protein PI125_g11910 [Phytophthora idaei]